MRVPDYHNAVIYGIYDNNTDELLYVGSTIHLPSRIRGHESAIRTGKKGRLYDHIRSKNVTWKPRTIEKFPCDFIGQLLAREYQFIDELRPWYNEKRLMIKTCSTGCGRPLLANDECRVCETIAKQVRDHELHTLTYRPSLQERICFLCGSYGIKDDYGGDTTKEEISEHTDPVFDAILRRAWEECRQKDPMGTDSLCALCTLHYPQSEQWSAKELLLEWETCPLKAIRVTHEDKEQWFIPRTTVDCSGLDAACGPSCENRIEMFREELVGRRRE